VSVFRQTATLPLAVYVSHAAVPHRTSHARNTWFSLCHLPAFAAARQADRRFFAYVEFFAVTGQTTDGQTDDRPLHIRYLLYAASGNNNKLT